jgi:hypothetical protein
MRRLAASMGETAIPIDDDSPTGEDRFGQKPVQKYSSRAAAVAIAITIIIVGLVFYFRATLVDL